MSQLSNYFQTSTQFSSLLHIKRLRSIRVAGCLPSFIRLTSMSKRKRVRRHLSRASGLTARRIRHLVLRSATFQLVAQARQVAPLQPVSVRERVMHTRIDL